MDGMDLVDEDLTAFVRPLGNLVILFGQTEAALLWLVAELSGANEAAAHSLLRGEYYHSVVGLCSRGGLRGEQLRELLQTLDRFWADRDERHRLMHDELYVGLSFEGENVEVIPATRGRLFNKGSPIIYKDRNPGEIWASRVV
jgi:hypothetical protein